MGTTTIREDYLGRDLVAPTTNALDYLGRPVGATTDTFERVLRRTACANSAAVTLDREIQFVGGTK
jgi:hypothetical protein